MVQQLKDPTAEEMRELLRGLYNEDAAEGEDGYNFGDLYT